MTSSAPQDARVPYATCLCIGLGGLFAGKPLLLHDTCKGDSGGPFFVADSKGRWLLAGVTSRGTDLATTMCGDGGLYVRVDQYRDWIKSVVDK